MSDKLKPCPCGETPESLDVQEDGRTAGKWMVASGACCGTWTIEFRANYKTGDELRDLAIEAWNDAPRKKEARDE